MEISRKLYSLRSANIQLSLFLMSDQQMTTNQHKNDPSGFVMFIQVFATREDLDVRLNGFDFTSPSTAVIGLSGGKMAVVDFRTDG